MPLFEQTQLALEELAATRQYDFGTHTGVEIKSGVQGRDVGEFPFNPAKHAVKDISPFSLMEHATGMPHVRMVIPSRPLEANILVHNDKLSRDDGRILELKNSLASLIRQSLEDSLPGIADRASSFEVGYDLTDDNPNIEVIQVDEPAPIAAASSVAEFCTGALSFVISDFRHLPLEAIGADYSSTVAIKVNHPAEIALPANRGIISLGGAAEVNTNKPNELAQYNAELRQQHRQIVERLQGVGIAVAHVIFNGKDFPKFGFDVDVADRQVAAAVNSLQA